MWKKTETDSKKKETKDMTEKRQIDYEDTNMKMFEQKTELLVKEKQVTKDDNDVLRNMIRSKCAESSEL